MQTWEEEERKEQTEIGLSNDSSFSLWAELEKLFLAFPVHRHNCASCSAQLILLQAGILAGQTISDRYAGNKFWSCARSALLIKCLKISASGEILEPAQRRLQISDGRCSAFSVRPLWCAEGFSLLYVYMGSLLESHGFLQIVHDRNMMDRLQACSWIVAVQVMEVCSLVPSGPDIFPLK